MRRILFGTAGCFGLVTCGNSKPEHVRPLSDSATEDVVWASTTDLRINELRGNDPAALELYNKASGGPVDLSGWVLTFPNDCEASLGEGARLGPGEFLLLWDETNMQCGVGDEGTITLRAPDGSIVDEVEWEVPFGRKSWCRIPDGGGAFGACSSFTPGGANIDLEPDKALVPTWSWSFSTRTEGLAVDNEGAVWAGLPPAGAATSLLVTDGSERADLDLSELESGTLEAPGWRGMTVLADGRIAVAATDAEAIVVVDPDSGAISTLFSTASEGMPAFIVQGPDDSLFVSFTGANRVAAYSLAGAPLWVSDADAGTPLHAPTAMVLVHDQLVVVAAEDSTLAMLDSSTGGLVGTISGLASSSLADIEPGAVTSEIKAVAWSETHEVLLLSERRLGEIKGFNTSDLDTLLDADQGWGYLGSAGWFGTGSDELGAPWVMEVAAADDMLVLSDIGNRWVNGYSMATVVATLSP
jgi:hypothetical protein